MGQPNNVMEFLQQFHGIVLVTILLLSYLDLPNRDRAVQCKAVKRNCFLTRTRFTVNSAERR